MDTNEPRFLVFQFDAYEALGGVDDLLGRFDSLEAVPIPSGPLRAPGGEWDQNAIDLQTGEIWERSAQREPGARWKEPAIAGPWIRRDPEKSASERSAEGLSAILLEANERHPDCRCVVAIASDPEAES